MTDIGSYPHRTEAGRLLAQHLSLYANRDDVQVLALPSGGVPVAVPVAEALGAPLDVMMVRKLGLPGQPEVAMAAIASVGGHEEVVRNEYVIDTAGVSEHEINNAYEDEDEEVRRRDQMYREGRPVVPLRGRTVILVHDGLATGATAKAAIAAVRHQDPARIIFAAPVGSPEAVEHIQRVADEVICPLTPERFRYVGEYYDDFSQVSDQEIVDALRAHAEFDPDPKVSMP